LPSPNWRARSVGERERGFCRCADEGGREGGRGSRLKWPRAGWWRAPRATWARSPRHAQLGRRLRGDEEADSPGPRAERAGEAGADAGKAAALTGGPSRAERRGGGGRRARGMGQMGRKAEGAGEQASFLFLLFWHLFSLFFLFTLFDSNPNKPQIQISISKNYAPNKSRI
jgi:hypothetical protein